jgi:translation initiation factor 1
MGKHGKKLKPSSESGGFVYSTNPNFTLGDLFASLKSTDSSKPELEAHFEKKGRGGKQVVLIKGFGEDEEEMLSVAKALRQHCGVGGSAKDGEIILQGNVRDKAMEYLRDQGYTVKRVGG